MRINMYKLYERQRLVKDFNGANKMFTNFLLTIFDFKYQECLEKIFKGFSLIPKNANSTLRKSNTAVTTLNKKIYICYLRLCTFLRKEIVR